MLTCKLGQTLHKLGPMTGIVRLIIQVDSQLLDMALFVYIALPPVFKAIDNKITSFKCGTKECRELITYHFNYILYRAATIYPKTSR
jgi:hypothetical protein